MGGDYARRWPRDDLRAELHAGGAVVARGIGASVSKTGFGSSNDQTQDLYSGRRQRVSATFA